MNWQPIDTAPKDGSWFLLRGGEIEDLYGEDEPNPPTVCAHWRSSWTGGFWAYAFAEGFRCAYDDPTEWGLLP